MTNLTPDTSILFWLIPLIIWEAVWKSIALWKAARNNQLGWFISFLALNTMGILPIVYLKFFQTKLGANTKPTAGTNKK